MKELKDLNLKSFKDLEKLDEKSLKEEYLAASKKMFTLNMKLQLRELKQTHLIKFLRRYIARIKTLSKIKQFNID